MRFEAQSWLLSQVHSLNNQRSSLGPDAPQRSACKAHVALIELEPVILSVNGRSSVPPHLSPFLPLPASLSLSLSASLPSLPPPPLPPRSLSLSRTLYLPLLCTYVCVFLDIYLLGSCCLSMASLGTRLGLARTIRKYI